MSKTLPAILTVLMLGIVLFGCGYKDSESRPTQQDKGWTIFEPISK